MKAQESKRENSIVTQQMPISQRINKIITEMLNRNNHSVMKSKCVVDPCGLYEALNAMSNEDLNLFKKQVGNSLELIDAVVRVKTENPTDPRQSRNCVVVPGNEPATKMSIAINDVIQKMGKYNARTTSSYVICPCELYGAVNEMELDEIAMFRKQWESSDRMIEIILDLRRRFPNDAHQQGVSRTPALEPSARRVELIESTSSTLACSRMPSQVGRNVLALEAPVGHNVLALEAPVALN